MKYFTYMYMILSVLFITYVNSDAQDNTKFLSTKGHDIIDKDGNKILLRGVGLGNWLLPEGYMWKFGPNGDRPRKIEKIVQDLIGKENAEEFWKNFQSSTLNSKVFRNVF